MTNKTKLPTSTDDYADIISYLLDSVQIRPLRISLYDWFDLLELSQKNLIPPGLLKFKNATVFFANDCVTAMNCYAISAFNEAGEEYQNWLNKLIESHHYKLENGYYVKIKL